MGGLTVGIGDVRIRSGLFAMMLAGCVIASACAVPVEGNRNSSGGNGNSGEASYTQ
jgi:hypothetical protein